MRINPQESDPLHTSTDEEKAELFLKDFCDVYTVEPNNEDMPSYLLHATELSSFKTYLYMFVPVIKLPSCIVTFVDSFMVPLNVMVCWYCFQ